MTDYTEAEISQAFGSILKGKFIKTAAKEWGIPRSTLQRRIQGAQSRASIAVSRQKLSPTQESHLVQ